MTSYDTEVGHAVMVEVSPDIHICGFCKQQYNNFEVFLAHKQNGCLVQTSEIPTSTATPAIKDSSAEFVYEETYQTCVMRGVKKVLTKAQKTPSKKPTPVLTSKRRSCCFSGCTFKTQYGQKDMERHLKTHTGKAFCKKEDKARKRRGTFKAEELNILLEEVEANKALLFNRFKGAHTNKQKTKKWREVAERMTAVTGTFRSHVEVRKKWQDFISLTKKKATDHYRQTTPTGAGLNTSPPLNNEEERAMAIVGCSASQGIPGGVVLHATIQESSAKPLKEEPEETISHQSSSAAPTSSSVLTTHFTPTATYLTLSTASLATASITAFSCKGSRDLVELEREKVSLLKEVCGLLREAAQRNKAFQEELIALKRAKLDIAARQLALEEEKFGQPPQRSIILPEEQDGQAE